MCAATSHSHISSSSPQGHDQLQRIFAMEVSSYNPRATRLEALTKALGTQTLNWAAGGHWLHLRALQAISVQPSAMHDLSSPFAALTLANVIVIIWILQFEMFNFNPELPAVSGRALLLLAR